VSVGDEQGYPQAHHVEMSTVDPKYRPTHSRAWRDPELEAHAEVDALTEELFALREQREYVASGGFLAELDDRIAVLEGRREHVASWHDDYRGVKSAGTDDRETWREVS